MTIIDIETGTWEQIAREAKGGIWPGRNELPEILEDAWIDGRFEQHMEFAKAIEQAWTGAEFPSRMLDTWEEMFGEVGFLHNDQISRRPRTIPTLYRAEAALTVDGAEFGWAEGMSWTASRETADWFYNRNKEHFGLTTRMLVLTNPDRFEALAHFDKGRNESEWVMTHFVYDDAEVIA